MARVNVEDLMNYVATGSRTPRAASQFGSLWGLDGLLVQEATPEQYAAFGAPSTVRLCHGEPVAWLGRQWSTILAYDPQKLVQVNIHTDTGDAVLEDTCGRLDAMLGVGEGLTPDASGPVVELQRRSWKGPGGVASIVFTPDFFQVSIEDVAHINASAEALRAPLSGMIRLTRWLGVLPLAAVGFMLPLVATWMVVDIVYLVAGRLSLLLFTLAAAVLTLIGNGIAGYTAIAFGTAVAPRARRKVGILLAVTYAIFTVVALILAWNRPKVGTGYISVVYLVANPAGLWWWWLVFAAVISVMAAFAAAVRRSSDEVRRA